MSNFVEYTTYKMHGLWYNEGLISSQINLIGALIVDERNTDKIDLLNAIKNTLQQIHEKDLEDD